jgi:tetratricopeptide (TPR) repeat protein
MYAAGFLAAILLALGLYGPALHGQFVFDDLFLAYTQPHAASFPMHYWTGLRPLLGLSYWANFQAAGLDPFTYHVVNVLLHACTSVVVFFLVRRVLELAGSSRAAGADILAGFSALLFLVHPVQTEAVAYVASRSETLSVLFVYGALCLFLNRRAKEIGWGTAAGVLVLFGCAISTKEHAIALPAVLLLTDYFWNPGFSATGIRKNWRLYAPLAAGACLAVAFVWSYVSHDAMIGFHVKGLAWYQYFFTECRAVYGYIGLFLWPAGLTVDHDFPVSLTLFSNGAAFALAGLAALAGAAVYYRKRYPLAAYGFFVFLLLLAPTSSFIPIRDVYVERRLYLPFLGLLIMAMEPLRRVELQPKLLAAVLACVCVVPAYLTWSRAHVWATPLALWQDSAAKSPNKVRARIGLGNAYIHAGRCMEAAREYEAAAKLEPPDFTLKYNLAAAFECLKQPGQALALLNDSIHDNPSAVASYALRGKVQAELQRWKESLDSLDRAEKIDPNYAQTHAYRGLILANLGRMDMASEEFRKCLEIDPNNALAQKGWASLNRGGAQ